MIRTETDFAFFEINFCGSQVYGKSRAVRMKKAATLDSATALILSLNRPSITRANSTLWHSTACWIRTRFS